MKECIFCKISNNELPNFQLFEDDLVKAFLDVNPVVDGHILVIPKNHSENVFDTTDEVLKRINVVCKNMAILCKNNLKATGVNILNASGKDAQQSVSHLHFHVIPRFENDDLNLWFHGNNNNFNNLKEIQSKLLL